MLSLKLILLLLAMAVGAIVITRLSGNRQRLKSQKTNRDSDARRFSVPHTQTIATTNPAAIACNADGDTATIEIDADRPMDGDLIAELELADKQIRDADSVATNTAQQNVAPSATAYGPGLSISDAELIEPDLTHNVTEAKQSQNTGLPNSPDSSDQSPPALQTNDLTSILIEANTSQLMLLDSFTEMIKRSNNVAQSIERAGEQTRCYQRMRAETDARQERDIAQTRSEADQWQQQLRAEQKARQSLEKLMTGQKTELERARTQIASLKKTLRQRQGELEVERLQLAKARMMARSAAKLARHAALNQQQARSLAEQEKLLRHKVESRTQKAITIAKNAITALAEQERKSKINSLLN